MPDSLGQWYWYSIATNGTYCTGTVSTISILDILDTVLSKFVRVVVVPGLTGTDRPIEETVHDAFARFFELEAEGLH